MSRRRKGRRPQDSTPRADALRFVIASAGIVRRVLRSAGVPPRDLDDAVQEVLIRGWGAVERGRLDHERPQAMAAYLRVVAVRLAAEMTAKAKGVTFLEDVEVDLVDVATSPAERALARDLLRELRAATTPERWAAWLAAAEGTTIAVISSIQAITPETALARVRLARLDFSAAILRERAREQAPRRRRGKP
jgi:DNA-directed RNA polymerase specialized sigma24 family protein